MNRFSIRLKPHGSVTSIQMTSRFLGIPIFKVYAFYVDGLLIDTGFVTAGQISPKNTIQAFLKRKGVEQ